MKNLLRRNRTYYIRLFISPNMQQYFKNRRLYTKSLGVKNLNDATIISKYLVSKFNYIKKSMMLLTQNEIQQYSNDFQRLNYQDILNRNHHISLEQINNDIELLNADDLNIYSEIIKDELYDLMELIDTKYNKNSLEDMDTADADVLVKHVKKFKLTALLELKNKINTNITVQTKQAIAQISTPIANNGITIEDALVKFDTRRKSKIGQKQFDQSTRDLKLFINFCNIHNFKYVKNLENDNIVDFREHLKKIRPNAKTSSIRNMLTSITTFLNYCYKIAHYLPHPITSEILPAKTIKEQKEKVQSWTDAEIKDLFANIRQLTHDTANKARKYTNEYDMILKLGMYTGARENEIIQLTKQDIKRDDNNILYININIEEDKSIKNFHSIRKVPIHKDLEKDLLAYISNKKKYLFTITASIFSGRFSTFKKGLGYLKTIKVFHSFRHSLQNKLKQQMVQNEIINELTGHSQSENAKQTDGYTDRYELAILKAELEKIKFVLN